MASTRSSAMKCEACAQDYDTTKRKPKFLKCFHTFCLSCLEVFKTNRTTIACPTCAQEIILHSESIDKSLQTNFYIMNQLENQNLPAIAETPDVESPKKDFYWCINCNTTVTKNTSCLKNHDTHDLEEETGREMADSHLKSLLITCKAQWNTTLVKHREMESAFKAAKMALQAVEAQLDTRTKENEQHIAKIQNHLSDVAVRLSKPLEENETGENIHRLFQEYSQLTSESKQKKTTDFDSMRDAIVSVDVQNSRSGKLSVPLFNRALINLPAKGANNQETNLLTSLAILILLSIQKPSENQEPSAASFLQQTKSKNQIPKSRRKTTEIKYVVPQRKMEASGKEDERKNISRPLTRTASDLDLRSVSFECTKTDGSTPKPCSSSPQTDFDRIVHFRSSRQEQLTRNEPLPTKLNPSTPEFQPSRTTYEEIYQVKPSVPSLMSLEINKVVFNLAVNGRPYGSIVFELRPDLAPVMCQRFVQSCQATEGPAYPGTVIYQSKPKTYIMGGKFPGPESLYMADPSPLKKTRGAIFFRLKRDYVKTQCSIVSTEFCIHLGEESNENHRTSTVFGYVCDGFAVCDAISYMDCNKDHVAIASARIVR